MRTVEAQVDHRGDRRLGRLETCVWYSIAAVTYIGFGIFHKFLLNWFVGPVWLVATVVIGPAAWDVVRGRRRSAR